MLLVLTLLVGVVAAPSLAQQRPTSPGDSVFVAARQAVHEGRFELADDLLHEALDVQPSNRLAWAYLAVVDVSLYRDPTDALNLALGELDSTDGSFSSRRMAVIVADFAAGEFDVCIDELFELLEENPEDMYARDLLGMTYMELGMWDEAVEEFRALLRDNDRFLPGWYHLGTSFLHAGDLPKARVAHTRFLSESDRDNPAAFDAMAEVFARSGETDQAVSLINHAIELEPRMAFAWLHMGDILADDGKPVEASIAYQNAIDSSHLYGDAFREMAADRLANL